MSTRLLLLSIDGVSKLQFDAIAALSDGGAMLRDLNCIEINSQPFQSAQPIWAEVLTGAPWFDNGCCGYVRPSNTLARSVVMSESQLAVPVNLLGDARTALAVNVPLLEPHNRLWLADGSLPTAINYSPRAELQGYMDGNYKPRPYSSLAKALTDKLDSAREVVEADLHRLSVTTRILKNEDVQQAIVRLSSFDQLQHLCGDDCFSEEGLIVRPMIERLVAELDRFLTMLRHTGWRIFVTSLFSHHKCRSRFSLNALLMKLKLLTMADPASSSRAAAFAAVSGSKPSRAALSQASGSLAPAATTAASPTAGAVYLNLQSIFGDGTIGDTDTEQATARVRQLVEERLDFYFGGRAAVFEKPDRSRCTNAPQFMVYVPHVELTDATEYILNNRDKPATCHNPQGFLLHDEKLTTGSSCTTLQVNSILRNAGFGQ